MGSSARWFVVASALVCIPSLAFAQLPSASTPAPPPPGGDSPTAAAAASGTSTAAPAADEKKPAREAAGYAYDDKKPAPRRTTARVLKATGPIATLPGFEPTADGGSRFFVQLTQAVPVEERRAQGSVTYVLRGAHVRVWNNTHALVTVHFNTPAWRARLVPQGNDLLFTIDLRADATPTYKMTEGPNKSSILLIEFPKGNYGGDYGGPAPAARRDPNAPSPAPTVDPGAAPAPQPGPNP